MHCWDVLKAYGGRKGARRSLFLHITHLVRIFVGQEDPDEIAYQHIPMIPQEKKKENDPFALLAITN